MDTTAIETLNPEVAKESDYWPLWRMALKALREHPKFGYGLILDTEWFERQLSADRNTTKFAFSMIALRQELFDEDGYYLQSQTVQDDETTLKTERWQIPSAYDHGLLGYKFDTLTKRNAWRAAHIRKMTLNNESAQLTESQRVEIDAESRIAAIRCVLLNREKSIIACVKKHQPKLLEKKSE